MPLAPSPTLLRRFPGQLAQALMAESTRGASAAFDTAALTALAGWLAGTPCSPLFERRTSPDLKPRALVQ